MNTNENLYMVPMYKRNANIDVFKGVACILVVFLHQPFPGIVGVVVQNLANFAVPYFFLVAGFGCARAEYKNIHIKKHIRHILKVTMLTIMGYLMLTLIGSYGCGKESLDTILSQIDIKRVVLLNDIDFSGGGASLVLLSFDLLLFNILCFEFN